MKTIFITLLTLIATIAIAALAFIYSGMFNVSARWEDPDSLKWVLTKTRESSVNKHAKDIKENNIRPGDKQQIENGFRSYREMCVTCHSAPGEEPSPVAVGLSPTPPNLTKKAEHEKSAQETFWVIKNGIRMTGMPSWGVTHGDDELWDVVAFLKVLPELSSDDYKALNNTVAAGHGHGGDSHGGGSPSDHGSDSHSGSSPTEHSNDSHSDSSPTGHGHTQDKPVTTMPAPVDNQSHDSHTGHAH